MIADVRLFRHGASVGSRVAPHLWCFVLAGATPRLGPATLKRALERATRLAPAHRVVAVVSRDSAPHCAGLLAETPDVATIVQPVYRGSAAELFLPALLVAQRDPDAVILGLRADETHDGPVAPCLARAIRAVGVRPDLTVLIGARPRTTRAPDGFVEPGSPLEGLEDLSLLAVHPFVYEAPRGLCARGLLAPAALPVRAPWGVRVPVASSWPPGVALTAWTAADALLPDAVPGRSAGAYAATAVATAAALAPTIALHEAAHCAVARRAGLGCGASRCRSSAARWSWRSRRRRPRSRRASRWPGRSRAPSPPWSRASRTSGSSRRASTRAWLRPPPWVPSATCPSPPSTASPPSPPTAGPAATPRPWA